jgi:acid phosphatase type 7
MMRLTFFFLLFFQLLNAKEIVYLSWQDDPDSSIIIHRLIDEPKELALFYRKQGESEWMQKAIEEVRRPDFTPFHIQRVFLTDLKENTLYEFRWGEGAVSLFHTAPASLDRTVKMVFGGDLYHESLDMIAKMNKIAAQFSPLAAVLGGDLAYSYARSYQAQEDKGRWIDWLDLWAKTMVREDGALIPMIAAIGNHEIGIPISIPFLQAPLFFDLFAIEYKKTYRKVAFDNWLALFILDTGHAQSITGPQLNWLSKEAKKELPYRYKIAVYHVPAWPSFRSFDGGASIKVRKNWLPLFEKMGIQFAFENHDHLYKRTFPLLNGQKDDQGVIYIGSGGWGGANHRPHPERPYLAKTVKEQSLILAEFSWQEIVIKAISEEGKIIDEIHRSH